MHLNLSTDPKHSYFLNQKTCDDSLQNSLSHFGLNPQDWRLVKHQENLFYIENKIDPDFKFIGSAHPKNAFENIFLISL